LVTASAVPFFPFRHISQQLASAPFCSQPDLGRIADQLGILGLARVFLHRVGYDCHVVTAAGSPLSNTPGKIFLLGRREAFCYQFAQRIPNVDQIAGKPSAGKLPPNLDRRQPFGRREGRMHSPQDDFSVGGSLEDHLSLLS
jgi:hypothetical protein